MLPSIPANTSGTARLMVDAPSYAVGWQEPRYLANPAPGAELQYKVDGRYYERLVSAQLTFTASAAVGQRFQQLALLDTNGTEVLSVPIGSGTAAGQALQVALMLHAPGFSLADSGGSWGFIPDLLIPPGWSWKSITFGIDVADQYSGIVLVVQRFPNDAASIPAEQ